MRSIAKGIGATIAVIGGIIAGVGMYNNSAASTVGAIIVCVGVLVFAAGSMFDAPGRTRS